MKIDTTKNNGNNRGTAQQTNTLDITIAAHFGLAEFTMGRFEVLEFVTGGLGELTGDD